MSAVQMFNITQTDNPTKPTTVNSQVTYRNTLRYQTYEERLKSFDNWPKPEVSKESLAASGFFYKQHSDVVQCPFCFIEGYSWNPEDDPLQDHRSWNPNCRFVMSTVEHDNQVTSNDTCGLYGIQNFPNSVPEDLGKLGVHKTIGPVQPTKHSVESRLATYEAWPKSMRQTPQQLAEAGFYYIGVGDQTMCFYCGGGLKDWEPTDDPWEQHAKWFPTCNFLHLSATGREYLTALEQANNTQDSFGSKEEEPCSATAAPPAVAPTPINTTPPSTPNSSGDSKALCKICYKNEVGVVFLPCGHVVACVDCAVAMRNCPICRKPLEATVRAFLS